MVLLISLFLFVVVEANSVWIAGHFGTSASVREREAHMLVALDHVNNKSDGWWDDLLPDYTLFPLVNKTNCLDDLALKAGIYNRLTEPWSSQVFGVIGGVCSSECKASATFFKLFPTPQISPSATLPALSDKTLYPYFARTATSDVDQVRGMVDMCMFYNWKTVGVVFIRLDYQLGLANEFVTQFLKRDVANRVAIQMEIPTGSTVQSTQTLVKSLADSHVKIIFLAVTSTIARTVWFNATLSMGLLMGPEYIWLGTDWPLNYILLTPITQYSFFPNIVMFTPKTQVDSIQYSSYLDEWKQKNASIFFDQDGDRNTLNTYSPHTYDAVIAMAHAFHHVAYVSPVRRNLSVFDSNLGIQIFSALLNNVSFGGITGWVDFDQQGDRTGSYLIQLTQNGSLLPFANWSIQTGIIITNQFVLGYPKDGGCLGCNNRGTCLFGQSICQCTIGWSGAECELFFPLSVERSVFLKQRLECDQNVHYYGLNLISQFHSGSRWLLDVRSLHETALHVCFCSKEGCNVLKPINFSSSPWIWSQTGLINREHGSIDWTCLGGQEQQLEIFQDGTLAMNVTISIEFDPGSSKMLFCPLDYGMDLIETEIKGQSFSNSQRYRFGIFVLTIGLVTLVVATALLAKNLKQPGVTLFGFPSHLAKLIALGFSLVVSIRMFKQKEAFVLAPDPMENAIPCWSYQVFLCGSIILLWSSIIYDWLRFSAMVHLRRDLEAKTQQQQQQQPSSSSSSNLGKSLPPIKYSALYIFWLRVLGSPLKSAILLFLLAIVPLAISSSPLDSSYFCSLAQSGFAILVGCIVLLGVLFSFGFLYHHLDTKEMVGIKSDTSTFISVSVLIYILALLQVASPDDLAITWPCLLVCMICKSVSRYQNLFYTCVKERQEKRLGSQIIIEPSLKEVLANQHNVALFREYCTLEFCAENVDCYSSIEKFKQNPSKEEFCNLYKKFVCIPEEDVLSVNVNISHMQIKHSEALFKRIQQNDPSETLLNETCILLDSFQKEIEEMLSLSFERFKRHSLWNKIHFSSGMARHSAVVEMPSMRIDELSQEIHSQLSNDIKEDKEAYVV